ncbi:MAG: DUF721 domain-containing protein [Coriobacteriia bacterium]|nr:DUF721 domain-containing protein [Coriobacteriia bacterium]
MTSEGPRSLGDGLRRLTDRLGGRERGAELRISSAWADVVGEEIARHTAVLGLRNGELLVGTDSPAWAGELSLMAEDLLARLGEATGERRVRSLRFAASKEVERARSRESAEAAAKVGYAGEDTRPVPLDSEEIASVRRSVEGVENEALREAAFKAIVKDLEWKKALRNHQARGSESGGPEERDSGRKR